MGNWANGTYREIAPSLFWGIPAVDVCSHDRTDIYNKEARRPPTVAQAQFALCTQFRILLVTVKQT